MTTVGEATAKERKHAMRAAVSYNLPCDVRVESRGYPVHMKSRFFAIHANARDPLVLIEAPAEHGIIVPLRPDDTLEVFFRVDLTRYTYWATVRERTQFRLANGQTVRALETTYPRRMTRGQRREFFRIAVSDEVPMPLTLGLLPRGGDDTARTGPAAFTRRAEIVNVSAGGLAFDLWEAQSRGIRQEDRLICDLTLPNHETVSLRGRIAAMYHLRGHGLVRYGVEFTGLDTSMELRIAQDRLLRYVVDVQRQELAKRSGLND